MVIRLSVGSAARLGLIEMRQLCHPECCYCLIGNKCTAGCSFCSQSVSAEKLSRISWPRFEIGFSELAAKAKGSGFKRVCLQCTSCSPDIISRSVKELTAAIGKLRSNKREQGLKLSLSYNFTSLSQLYGFLGYEKLDNICIPIDVADPFLFRKIRHQSFSAKLKLLLDAAGLLNKGSLSNSMPATNSKLATNTRLTTHLIAGLGETIEQMFLLFLLFRAYKITVGLFAFTPLQGTKLEKEKPPELGYYRMLQASLWLISKGFFDSLALQLKKKPVSEIMEMLAANMAVLDIKRIRPFLSRLEPEAFRTAGCSGCNRPYYNERPGQTPYNFPEQLTKEQMSSCLSELNSFIG